MPNVQQSAYFSGVSASAVFRHAIDFERYSEITESVRQVRVVCAPDGLQSHWDANFRRGVLHWSERDVIDHQNRTIEFTQIAGDLADFHGRWIVRDIDGGTEITFNAHFDLGMPTLSELLDPVAERALKENIGELMAAFAAAAQSQPTAPATAA